MYPLKCDHELKHNKDTDIVFCVKCGEKWEKGKIEYIPQYITNPNGQTINTPVHYHNGVPCYNNPCVWSGN